MIQYKEATTLLYNFHVTVNEIIEIIIVFCTVSEVSQRLLTNI